MVDPTAIKLPDLKRALTRKQFVKRLSSPHPLYPMPSPRATTLRKKSRRVFGGILQGIDYFSFLATLWAVASRTSAFSADALTLSPSAQTGLPHFQSSTVSRADASMTPRNSASVFPRQPPSSAMRFTICFDAVAPALDHSHSIRNVQQAGRRDFRILRPHSEPCPLPDRTVRDVNPLNGE